jgi:glutamyl-tRNA reductase
MDLIISGLNHRTAPVDVREKVCFSSEEAVQALKDLRKVDHIRESLILSTCNRTELYACMADEIRNGDRFIQEFIKNFKNLRNPLHNKYFYTFHSENTVKHLFEVASGIDSMIIGENQVLGQVKDAYHLSCEAKSNGIIINRLFHWAFKVGKRARTETEIGMGAVSVSSAATELAQKIFKDLSKHSAFLIGAGETGELTAQCLQERAIQQIFITNRTFRRAQELAQRLDAKPVEFSNMEKILSTVDVVISSTGSKEFIVTADLMKKVMASRNHRPLFIIDIAVPRDFDPQISKINNVFLHSIDDLQKIIDKNVEKRKTEITKVHHIIKEESNNFVQWQKTLRVTPIIKGLQRKVEEIRTSELNKNKKQFKEEDWSNLDLLTKSMIKKIIRTPLLKIKEFNEDSHFGLMRLDTAREFFELDEYLDDISNGDIENED